VCSGRRRGVAALQLPLTGTAVRCRRKQNEDYARPIHVMCSTTRGTSHIKAFSEIIEFIIVRVYRLSIVRTMKTVRKKLYARNADSTLRVSELQALPLRTHRSCIAVTKTNVLRAPAACLIFFFVEWSGVEVGTSMSGHPPT